CTALEQLGAEAIRCPAIAFEPMSDARPLRNRLDHIADYDWIVFTSSNGVRFFADAWSDRALPAELRIAVVGSSTAEAAAAALRRPDLIPDRFDAEHLLDALGEVRGRRILLPQAEAARPTLADGLAGRGAEVDAVPIYRTVAGDPSATVLEDVRRGVDALTFTSPTTAVYFAELLGADALRVAASAAIVCIGPVTAAAVRELGWSVDAVAEPHTVDGLVEAVVHQIADAHASR
ncbi:MAG: uroporphyrinogen-III synthase, partial [Rhodothermales bacterium]|nr:uroporphyrinogen-III synthase [Rhodothermales bacterium]